MIIFIGADHGGFEYKQKLIKWLTEKGHTVTDCGNVVNDPFDDYPDFAFAVTEKVVNTADSFGILLCRSSAGMIIASNKVKGIRAVAVFDEKQAEHARAHNNANVFGLSADWLSLDQCKLILEKVLTTPFSNEERHVKRLSKITEYENRIYDL